MSKLLHSKTFRNNLIKWMMIYICVMLSTISVITYSKYISDLQTDSLIKPAKFVLNVSKGDICSATKSDECNIDKYKIDDEIDYNFNVDTTEIEVNSLLVITIAVNDNFNIENLFIDNNEIDLNNTDGYEIENNVIVITDRVGIINNYSKNFKVRLSLKSDTTSYNLNDVLIVNYAATQID